MLWVSGQLHPRKITSRLGLQFSLGLVLELRLGGGGGGGWQFSWGTIFWTPLLIVRFAEIWNQTNIQIIKKSSLHFLINSWKYNFMINYNRWDLSKTIATSKTNLFVTVCGLQLSIVVTKNYILGITGVLDPLLELYNVF